MDYTLSCPECGGKVKIPDSLLGKKVRCPRCQATYKAEPPGGAVDVVEVLDEPPRRRPASPPDGEYDDRPRRRPRDDDYEDDYDDRPQRVSRSEVRSRVQLPAIGLMITGAVYGLLMVVNLGITVYAIYEVLSLRGPGIQVRINWAPVIGRVFGSLIGFAIAGVIIAGGNKLRNLEGYGLVVAAAILSLLPSTCALILLPIGIARGATPAGIIMLLFSLIGLPIAIWTLILLGSRNVKRAFK